ncbi:hypothetical protein INR49_029582 [Caranx melampygus]|nr:hypothetical protein INR49_029582 [Caranx melampygus]
MEPLQQLPGQHRQPRSEQETESARKALRRFLSSLQTVAIFRSMKSVLRSTATLQPPRTVRGPRCGQGTGSRLIYRGGRDAKF